MVGALSLGVLLAPSGVAADELGAARMELRAAEKRVAALQPRLKAALAAYDQTMGALATGVSRSLLAEQAADEADQEERRTQSEVDDRVRALYISGGSAGLVASVLTAPSASSAFRQVSYVQHLVRDGSQQASRSRARAELLREHAVRLETAAGQGTARAADVQRRYEEAMILLADATLEVERLSARARSLREAAELAARVAALNEAVARTAEERIVTAQATAVPARFAALYESAAKTCPGMSWTLLAAVGQVESGHGANPGVSYAGAQGPMQFMPATFAAYGVDGDNDGDTDVFDPADAVYSAANYLCANGAGRGGRSLEQAIWRYNQADWYVRLVLKLAEQYAARGA